MNHHLENHPERQEEDACTDAMERERRKNNRRTSECQGFAYIEMVGWMDRRERVRRNTDPTCF